MYQSGNWYYANNYVLKPEPNTYDSYGSINGWGGGWIFNATHTNLSPSPSVNPRNDTWNFYFDLWRTREHDLHRPHLGCSRRQQLHEQSR